MDAKAFVDSLFEGYEETAALADFKEELLGNLNAKIDSFTKKGMDAETAFAKASAELGDVSALATELSIKKRKEVFEEVYMDIKAYMTPGRVTAYVIFVVVALFGITIGLISLFAVRQVGLYMHIDLTAFFGSMMPFLTAAAVGFTYLGMTQETPSMYPVSKKRGAGYATAAGLIAFGLFTMPVTFFSTRFASEFASEFVDGLTGATIHNLGNVITIVPVLGLLIPFVLPGIGILVYLCLTEKDRMKHWAKDFHNKTVKGEMAVWSDPATASRFGMYSGAIWIFAIGLFVLLGFVIGFRFSWLVFLFATAIQLVVQGMMSKPKNGQ